VLFPRPERNAELIMEATSDEPHVRISELLIDCRLHVIPSFVITLGFSNSLRDISMTLNTNTGASKLYGIFLVFVLPLLDDFWVTSGISPIIVSSSGTSAPPVRFSIMFFRIGCSSTSLAVGRFDGSGVII
jgi:hypothetical protein